MKLQRSISFNEAISDWVSPLRYIVALGTGRKEESTYLSIRVGPDRSDDLTFQVYGSSLGQMPYASDGNAILKVRRAFSISTHHLSLLELLRSWQELERLHHPLLETYGSLMFVAEQHPRSRYLLLIQALEGLDGFDTRADRQKNVAAHSGRRTAVLEALQRLAGALGSEEIKFIKKFLNKRPLSSLDDCLRRTIQGLPIDTASELGDTALVRSVMAERANGDYATCLRIVRNDLAHGNRGYDAFELHEAAEILDRVVRAHLAKALGCGDTVQSRILEKDH
ncbi:hypothetical protein [Actinocatenispora comari]|uniref:hypothetical protein n=1 Tax=Actinocatenispora comari TaxID=2807577 RepID=UPI001A91F737